MAKFDGVRMQDLIEVQDPDPEGGLTLVFKKYLPDLMTTLVCIKCFAKVRKFQYFLRSQMGIGVAQNTIQSTIQRTIIPSQRLVSYQYSHWR